MQQMHYPVQIILLPHASRPNIPIPSDIVLDILPVFQVFLVPHMSPQLSYQSNEADSTEDNLEELERSSDVDYEDKIADGSKAH